MSRNEIRDILRRAKSIGQMQPSPDSTARAVERVRQSLLTGSPAPGARSARRMLMRKVLLRVVMPASIAAMVLVAAGFMLFSSTQRHASAAELLKEVAQTSAAYKGWVHIKLESINIPASADSSMQKIRGIAMHFDTVDGAVAIIMEAEDQRNVCFISPSRGEIATYDSQAKQLTMGPMDPQLVQSIMGPAPNLVTPEGLLEMFGDGDKQIYTVKLSREGGLDRFDVTCTLTAAPSEPGRTVKWLTILADPQTRLVQKLTAEDWNSVTFTFAMTYGEPAIADIYSLDVPRDARVIDKQNPDGQASSNPASQGATQPAVPGDVRVQDNRPTEQARALAQRLDDRIEKGFGDGVALLVRSTPSDESDAQRAIVQLFAVDEGKWLTLSYRMRSADDGSGAILSPQGRPDNWPRPEVKQVLSWLPSAKPFQFFLLANQHALLGWYQRNSRSYSSKVDLFKDLDKMPWKAEQGVAGQIWPSMRSYSLFGPRVKQELLTDPARPGLVGLRVEWPGNSSGDPAERTVWIDPARDDVPVEDTYRTYTGVDRVLKEQRTLIYDAYAQLPTGQWYPTRWHKTSVSDSGQGMTPANGNQDQYDLQIVPGFKLSSEWFVSPADSPAPASTPASGQRP